MEKDYSYLYYEHLETLGQSGRTLENLSSEIKDILTQKPKKKTRRGTKGIKRKNRGNAEDKIENNYLFFIQNVETQLSIENQLKLIEYMTKKVLGEEIHFKKRGSHYYALCPFHQEENPSLAFNTSSSSFKGHIHCYGCQAGFDNFFGMAQRLISQKKENGSYRYKTSFKSAKKLILTSIVELGFDFDWTFAYYENNNI